MSEIAEKKKTWIPLWLSPEQFETLIVYLDTVREHLEWDSNITKIFWKLRAIQKKRGYADDSRQG